MEIIAIQLLFGLCMTFVVAVFIINMIWDIVDKIEGRPQSKMRMYPYVSQDRRLEIREAIKELKKTKSV